MHVFGRLQGTFADGIVLCKQVMTQMHGLYLEQESAEPAQLTST